ncbi:PTS galactitol transporter subunit IIB [Cryobacterium suzukii]|uniref:PTS galactitol transporter subunit IIB n=1 Tax=Cryobacterium suzukii TaxID=1259198 RepID=A0A4R9AHZ1_9MICO|nr:PTS sugar transporter subunit IIB [Cryobacterium suzukii]TFD61467.1 PTS galactitol transporter subunit IIB [Cryobacterium suzukii]
MAHKKILVVCGTGAATSTVVAVKLKEFCLTNGYDVSITQGKVSDILRGQASADFIVATTQVPASVAVPVIAGLPFLTGMGLDQTFAQIEAALKA